MRKCDRVRILSDHSVRELRGEGHVREMVMRDEKSRDELILPVEYVIICPDRIPNSELASGLGCDLDRQGFILVDREQKTTIPGLFAAGDVAGVVMAAIKSAGEGSVAGLKAADYLRTGDLGFLDQNTLYVTGRLKDVIIIRGRNYYPQDIELSAWSSHPALKANGAVTFSAEPDAGHDMRVVRLSLPGWPDRYRGFPGRWLILGRHCHL